MNDPRPPAASSVARRVVWTLAAVIVLPHELAHALAARLAGLTPVVEILPQWDGAVTPLGRFDAAIGDATPTWAIRAVAVAPLPIYLGVTAGLRLTVAPEGPVVVPLLLHLAYSANLSGGDIAVCARPTAARDAGAFVVPASRWQALPVLTAPVTTAAVAALLLVG